ncbi:hypothetical protein FHW92_003635 [Novosphingobium sp. SG707]|nr:hypothetical protein [Novosphingobium sp. SG707]
MRGVWDLPGHCRLSSDVSDSRAIVREIDVVFWETVFTPRRILISGVSNWTAAGAFDEEGEVLFREMKPFSAQRFAPIHMESSISSAKGRER